MTSLLSTLRVIAEIAFRNLFASKWKTLIVGGIIGFGAFLVVVGSSLVDGVDRSMRRSITGSIAGHIQVYSSKSKEDLEIMGSMGGSMPDIDPLYDFEKVKKTLLSIPNVADVVPMGVNAALVSSGNTVDQALSNLRSTVNAMNEGDKSRETQRKYEAQKAHVQQMVKILRREMDNAKQVSSNNATDELEAVERAASDQFWSTFDSDRYEHLELLENHIAPMASDADLLQLRYVGTDPQAFAKAFDRLQIVDGEMIPAGQRGFLFSKYVYEEQVKLKTARGLDKLKSAIDERHVKIAQDLDLQRIVRENTTGVRELLLQLDAIRSDRFRQKLQGFLHSSETDVAKLLASFLATDDKNFHERYDFFYRELAPDLELYRVRIGDSLMVKAFTQSGYVQSANLKVYGTYSFKGLERSPQAGLVNMMDLVSFRELYGFMTNERAQEIAAIRASSGAKEVDRANAEAELFGARPQDDAEQAKPAADSGKEEADPLAALRGKRARLQQRGAASFDPAELEQGVALSAAVLVKDESKIDSTIQAITEAGKKAGLPLKAITWQKAAGIIGQFATLMRAVLLSTVLIIFVVALVVINNALVMATLERVREIGTLRAVGAQRRFILAMLVLESVVIGLASGAVGAILGTLLLVFLGRVGIPATTEQMSFFFSGPRLFPSVTVAEIVFALGTVLIVSMISSIYPAWLAMRVSPREAMQSED